MNGLSGGSSGGLSGGSSGGSSGGLFGGLFGRGAAAAATGDRAWLRAMLDAEAALARAQARAGLIASTAADAIARACRPEDYDIEEIGRAAATTANPVVPLVRALRDKVGVDAAGAVHRGATSQDILDTAAMLVAGRALDPLLADLAGVADACARLARAHRDTPMAGRTLMQQAVPTTFGLTAAGWLTAVDAARVRLAYVRDNRLAAQLGGAAGTMAALGAGGVTVLGLFAALLAAMPQEHERAAGGWQAEWEPLTELLRLTGSAAAWIRDALDGLRIDADRMRRNLELTGGLLMAERDLAPPGGDPPRP